MSLKISQKLSENFPFYKKKREMSLKLSVKLNENFSHSPEIQIFTVSLIVNVKTFHSFL
jgi:hypothetical protein